MFVRAYLRASTSEQDATRAREQLEAFAAERNLTIAASYVENESGAKLGPARTVPPPRRLLLRLDFPSQLAPVAIGQTG